MENKKIYFIDIDNTICKTKNSNYIHSIPDNMICNLNKLYYSGNDALFYSPWCK